MTLLFSAAAGCGYHGGAGRGGRRLTITGGLTSTIDTLKNGERGENGGERSPRVSRPRGARQEFTEELLGVVPQHGSPAAERNSSVGVNEIAPIQ